MEQKESSIVVVHCPELWNRRLVTALNGKYKVCRCEGPAETLLARSHELAPCLLLMDSNTALRYAEDNQQAFLTAHANGISILAMGNQANHDILMHFLYMGCKGVLNSAASAATIRKAVGAISEGQIWAPRQVLSNVLNKCLFQLGPNALTERERVILELISQGLTNREIAKHLFIARETVRWHIRSLYSKIGASDRLSAAVYAKEMMWLPRESPIITSPVEIAESLARRIPRALNSH